MISVTNAHCTVDVNNIYTICRIFGRDFLGVSDNWEASNVAGWGWHCMGSAPPILETLVPSPGDSATEQWDHFRVN